MFPKNLGPLICVASSGASGASGARTASRALPIITVELLAFNDVLKPPECRLSGGGE
jgi:hypothetical protein